MFSRVLTALTCIFVFTLGCQAREEGSPASGAAGTAESARDQAVALEADAVVARIGGEDVTLADLDAWIKDDLFNRQTGGGANPSKIYDLRAESLERMINKRVLAAEAARRNTTEKALIEDEITAMGEVSEESVAQFYEEQNAKMGGQTLEAMRPRIRDYLRQLRGLDVVKKMRTDAEIEVLLEPPRIEVAADGPSRGPANAPITIVEFSDFECPYCSRALPVIEEVLERYPNDVRLVFRHMPLDGIHARARPAAEASMCAGDQGQFWAYHDLLFADRRALSDEDLKRYAEELGLDVAAWEQCVSEGKFAAKVDSDVEAGRAIGVSGTPAFIINGVMMPAFIINGVMISGAKPLEHFVSLIESELERSESADRS
jgi:protein-disulfide isomerase